MSVAPPSASVALSDADKERIKLGANYLNSIAVAVFAIGGFAPAMSYLYGSLPQAQSPWLVAAIGLSCITASVGLPLIARRVLKGLSP